MKARVVRLAGEAQRTARAHLRYISREGSVGQCNNPLPAYDAVTESVDLEEFHARASSARHQFRFIVSPEDATDLGDLKTFTRQLMEKVAGDLGTRLDWVAVDHWDTDNPHTHIVLNGRTDAGKDLVIAGEYVARGLRVRASELATEWLGPRTELELQAGVRREVDADRWTSLDRQLKARVRDGYVDLSIEAAHRGPLGNRAFLIGRLNYLGTLGLARSDEAGAWQLRRDAEETLRHLGERGDIIRTMQRSFGAGRTELSIFDPAIASGAVVGRIADKGLADELRDSAFVVVDGVDGRGHYVKLPSATKLRDMPIGGILEVRPVDERGVDKNILAASVEGRYFTRKHEESLRASGRHGEIAADIVASHLRRLEALRRAGVVERVSDGVWKVPSDLVARGLHYDRRVNGDITLSLRCRLPIERQVRAIGATWLDELLVDPRQKHALVTGFGTEVERAVRQRREHLTAQGVIRASPADRDLLAVLRARDVDVASKALAVEVGLPYRPVVDGKRISGTYRRSVQLTSGRFAMLVDGAGFSLVPWRPVIESRLGKHLSAVMRGDHVAWALGQSRHVGDL